MFDLERTSTKPDLKRHDLAVNAISTKESESMQNDSEDPSSPTVVIPLKMICEPEITYLIDMIKLKTEKWSRQDVLKDLHK